MPRGARPNRPSPGSAADVLPRAFRPDLTPEDEMTITDQPLDVTGTWSVRVDCQCNAYARETVVIPHVVIFDALLGLGPDDDGRSVMARAMADPRVHATTAGDPTPKRPSRDFAATHMAQAAAGLRTRKAIPFTPFANNAWHLKNERPVYREWATRYLFELGAAADDAPSDPLVFPLDQHPAPQNSASAVVEVVESGPDITGRQMEAGTTVPVDDLPQAPEDGIDVPPDGTEAELAEEPPAAEPTESGPAVVDVGPFDSYPDPPSAHSVVEWIGDDYARAVHAWAVELDRPESQRRVSIRTACDDLGVDVG